MEGTALRAWLAAAADGADDVAAARAALACMTEAPWRAAGFAGLLARSERRAAPSNLGLTATLRVRDAAGASVVATVREGRPYPALTRTACAEPDRDLAMRIADAARSVLQRPVRSAVDLQCGVGTVLLALESWGVPELLGVAASPIEAALAAIVVPRARIVDAASGLHDVVVTRVGEDDDRFVATGGALALWMPESAYSDPAGASWHRRWLHTHALRGISGPMDNGGGPTWIAALAAGAGPATLPLRGPRWS